MLTKKVTKLWKGEYLSIRTYEHQAAIKADGLKLIYGDKTMTLSRQQLENLKPSSKIFKSKTGGRDYQLIDIKFAPNDPRQDLLL